MTLREWTDGRWPEIISAILGAEYANPRRHSPCPTGIGKDCYRFSDQHGGGNFFCKCSSDGKKGGFDLLQCTRGVDFEGAVKLVETVLGPRPARDSNYTPPVTQADRLKPDAVKIEHSAYLESRGLRMSPALRWHRRCPYYKQNDTTGESELLGHYPAMLAPITGVNGNFLTYHVTYLENGCKAALSPSRKILGCNSPLQGASCHLTPMGGDGVLGIAEGVETSLSVTELYGTACWAALNTSLMKSFVPPTGCRKLIIFCDNDANFAGLAAGYALAHKLFGRVECVEVKVPISQGDFNDILMTSKGINPFK